MPERVSEDDAWETRRLPACTEILDDRVRVEDMGRDVERVWTVHGVEVGAIEEADDAVFLGRFFWETGKEADKAGVDVVLLFLFFFPVHERHP